MASRSLAKAYVDLFEEMKADLLEAPAPAKFDIPQVTRLELANVEAISVMHGWMTRTLRTGETTLKMANLGFAAEVSPLIRSMIEHAISLAWLEDQRGDALQVLIRSRSDFWKRVELAQSDGWQIEGEDAQELLKKAIEMETDEETRTFDFLGHVAHQAQKYGLGTLYQAWLIETSTSHASIMSAQPYYQVDPNSEDIVLFRVPREMGEEVEAAVAVALFSAIISYNKLLEGSPLDSSINKWHTRFQELDSLLEKENSSRLVLKQ